MNGLRKEIALLDKIKKYIKQNNMLEGVSSVVVGVSGGADSMCLLSVLIELGVKVYVVHINHMLRGKAADEDMSYVENFCKLRDIKCYSFLYDVENISKEKKVSCEEAGRMVRYEAFYKVLKETKSEKIAVAHNAGDNAETILHNLFRGTGIRGLCGIVPSRDEIIRPLLCVDRGEIEGYLKERGIEYRCDATNAEDIYTRNKIRNTVLTYVKENINPAAVGHINMAGQLLGEIDDFISCEGDRQYEKCVAMYDKTGKDALQIMEEDFLVLHTVIKKYIIRRTVQDITSSLKDITFTHIANVLELFSNEVGKSVSLPYGIVARRSYDGVIIEKSSKCNKENSRISENRSSITEKKEVVIDHFGDYLLTENGEKLIVSPFSVKEWRELNDKYEEKIYTKWLDCGILDRNLVIRTRKAGDFIVVDSKGSRKKLKDFFINLKVPKEQRDKVLLLADGSEILWIIGYRINYNYRVTEETKEILKLEYKK